MTRRSDIFLSFVWEARPGALMPITRYYGHLPADMS